jgi:hypothetical protein
MAQLLGGDDLQRLAPMISIWHVLYRALLPALMKLLGEYWLWLVKLTRHSRKANLGRECRDRDL